MIFKDLAQIRQVAMPVDWWTKYFLHPFSIRLVSLIRDTKITPGQLTILSTALVFLAFPLIGWGNYASLLWAAFILQCSLILDCADGQLARLRKVVSMFGEWLDRGTDRIKDFLIIYALTFRYAQVAYHAWILGFACLFIIFFLDFLGLQAKLSPLSPFSEEDVDKKEKGIIKKLKNFKRKFALGFFQIGEQYFIYSLFLVLNRISWLFYFIIVYGSLAIAWFIFNTYRETLLANKRLT